MAGTTDPSEPDLTQNLTGFDSAVTLQPRQCSQHVRLPLCLMLLAIGLPQKRWTVTDRQTLRPSCGDGLVPAGER